MPTEKNPKAPGGDQRQPEDPRKPGTSTPGTTPQPMDRSDRTGPGGTTAEERDNLSQATERAPDSPPRHNL